MKSAECDGLPGGVKNGSPQNKVKKPQTSVMKPRKKRVVTDDKRVSKAKMETAPPLEKVKVEEKCDDIQWHRKGKAGSGNGDWYGSDFVWQSATPLHHSYQPQLSFAIGPRSPDMSYPFSNHTSANSRPYAADPGSPIMDNRNGYTDGGLNSSLRAPNGLKGPHVGIRRGPVHHYAQPMNQHHTHTHNPSL